MQTTIKNEQNILVVIVEGNINSVNANAFDEEMKKLPGKAEGVILDVHGLEYISSAGLRVILGLKKRCKEMDFRIIGANQEVMSVFDMTGFSEIMDIEPAMKEISIEGCEMIGKGACAECYRIDDERIVKLYYIHTDDSFIEHEKALAKKAFVMGIPTAISYDIVSANGRKGVIYELIQSKTLGELIRSDQSHLDQYIQMYADTCKKVCSIHTDDPEIPSFKVAGRMDISNVRYLSEEEKDYLYRFLDMVPDYNSCVHGDLNINNIMVQNGECCLIDMGELSTGIPVLDFSRILFSMVYANTKPGTVNAFYKMPAEKVSVIFGKFVKAYFGCETIEEAMKKDPLVKWVHPLAWFRCCTGMLRSDRWSEEFRKMAIEIFHEKLIPFVENNGR